MKYIKGVAVKSRKIKAKESKSKRKENNKIGFFLPLVGKYSYSPNCSQIQIKLVHTHAQVNSDDNARANEKTGNGKCMSKTH
jgi:hypothetical protein